MRERRWFMKKHKTAFFIVASMSVVAPSFLSGVALAQVVQSTLKTLYVSADYAMTTHKSKLVESNDTGSSVRYDLGFNIGAAKQIGLRLQSESSAIAFALNDSSTSFLFRDTKLTYRYGYFYLGAVSAYGEAAASGAGGTEMFSGRGTGFGYAAGFYLPVGRSVLQVDLTSASIASFLNKDESVEVSLGSRLDIDISGHIPLSKKHVLLDLGYRQRSLPISYAGTSYTDTIQNTYIGVTFGDDI